MNVGSNNSLNLIHEMNRGTNTDMIGPFQFHREARAQMMELIRSNPILYANNANMSLNAIFPVSRILTNDRGFYVMITGYVADVNQTIFPTTHVMINDRCLQRLIVFVLFID